MAKFLIMLIACMLAVPAYAHHDSDDKGSLPPTVTTYSAPAQSSSDPVSGNTVAAVSALATGACDYWAGTHQIKGTRWICGAAVLAANALRSNPNMDAAAIGVGIGTAISFTWKF